MGYRVIRSDSMSSGWKACRIGDYFYVHNGKSEQMWQCTGMDASEKPSHRWTDTLPGTMIQSILDNAEKPEPTPTPEGYGDF